MAMVWPHRIKGRNAFGAPGVASIALSDRLEGETFLKRQSELGGVPAHITRGC